MTREPIPDIGQLVHQIEALRLSKRLRERKRITKPETIGLVHDRLQQRILHPNP